MKNLLLGSVFFAGVLMFTACSTVTENVDGGYVLDMSGKIWELDVENYGHQAAIMYWGRSDRREVKLRDVSYSVNGNELTINHVYAGNEFVTKMVLDESAFLTNAYGSFNPPVVSDTMEVGGEMLTYAVSLKVKKINQ